MAVEFYLPRDGSLQLNYGTVDTIKRKLREARPSHKILRRGGILIERVPRTAHSSFDKRSLLAGRARRSVDAVLRST